MNAIPDNVVSLPAGRLQIEKGHPVPKGKQQTQGNLADMRAALSSMNIGDSFVWPDCYTPYRAAEQMGMKVTLRKLNGRGFRVWRVK